MITCQSSCTGHKSDFGVINSGGVRDSIENGKVTYKDVLKVQPFSNQVAYVDMTGAEILSYLMRSR